MQVKLRVFRFDSKLDKDPHYDTFSVDARPTDRLLDCLNKIRWEQDASLSYRMSCSHGICGSDGMTINGEAALACQKLVKDYDYTMEILVEPLQFFPVIRDLIVDMSPFFERMRSTHPERTAETPTLEGAKEVKQTADQRALFDDAIKCIMCACCVASCPVNLKEEPEFIGPAAILRAQRYIFDSRVKDPEQRIKMIDKPHGIWSCKTYFRCTDVCPKRIKVTEAILQVKTRIMEQLK